jgi:flagellar biosynthesis protein FliQ
MTQDTVMELTTRLLILTIKLGAPLLGVALLIGLVVSVFQAVTQIQEQTLSFIPKLIALAAVIVIGGPWMLGELLNYTTELWSEIPRLAGQ